ncbi:MAG: PAS domain S-box protein, partial [Chromatiales bacterium]|nr:PAS domain S-box protein [Chromatiales bacterium]
MRQHLNNSTKDAIKREQLKLLYAPLPGSLFAAILNALFLIFILWEIIAKPTLLFWFVALLGTLLYRLFIRAQFNRIADEAFPTVQWEHKFLFGLTLSAITWGTGAILLFPSESIALQAFLGFIFAGITAGSASTLAPNFRAILLFLTLMLIPLSLRLLLTETTLGISMGSLVLLYTFMLIASGHRFYQNIMENLKLRYEAQRREEELYESEEKYRLLFEKSEDPMWLISGTQFVMANQAAVNLLGYNSEDELTHTHPSELSPPIQSDGQPSMEKADEMMRIAYETGHNRFDWIHKKCSGESFPVDVNLTRIPFNGEYAIFCTWRDISTQKETEKALTNAKESADIANQSKSAFLA